MRLHDCTPAWLADRCEIKEVAILLKGQNGACSKAGKLMSDSSLFYPVVSWIYSSVALPEFDWEAWSVFEIRANRWLASALAVADTLKDCNNMTSSSLATFSRSARLLKVSSYSAARACYTTSLLTVSQSQSTRACDVETLWVQCTVGWAWKTHSKLDGIQLFYEPLPLFTIHLSFWENKTIDLFVQERKCTLF